LLLIDESGLLMAPLVRRSWALRGHRPQLLQKGRHREKVSVASALWVSGPTGRLRLSYRTVENGYFDSVGMADFLADLLGETRRPLVVVWDGGNMHRGDPIRDLLGRVGRRLRLERLPPYAPMLNPVESLWTWVKYGRLCNFAPRDAAHLNDALLTELAAIRTDQERLRSFCRASELGDVLTLLS
jgi:putative transposase